MLILDSFLLGVGLAMDAFSVSLSNGLHEVNMKKKRMVLMAGVYGFFQFVMPLIGWSLVHSLLSFFTKLEGYLPWIALLLLVFLGIKMILEGVHERKEKDEAKKTIHMSRGGILLQGIATSIDALSVGVTIADYDLPEALIASLIIGAVTFILCFCGIILGKKIGTKLSWGASILGGIILIAIGIKIFVSGIGLVNFMDEEYEARNRISSLYGVNREIEGDYDQNLAVKCNNGTFVGLKDKEVVSYKGIPYAVPPVDDRRWKKAEVAEDGDGVYEAYYFGPSPIQTQWASEEGSYYPQSEDCLCLNVWTNTKNNNKDKPVMVFFHGGSYGWGGTADPIYDGHNLVEKFDDIILITVEYRLGIFGFIDFRDVEGGEDFAESGNLGLLDQVTALQWIKKNVSKFGGNPENVTIFGESAGAGSVTLLPLMDGTEGLFQKVIAESGSPAFTFSIDECKDFTALLLERTGCSNMQELMALSTEELEEANEEIDDYNNFPERDGVILPIDLYGAYEAGEADAVDYLIGSNADELRYWIREMELDDTGIDGMALFRESMPILFENDYLKLTDDEKKVVNNYMALDKETELQWKTVDYYNELSFRIPAMKIAAIQSDLGNDAYTYYWTYPGEDDRLGACHAIELSYVFNNLDEKIYTGDKVNPELADMVQNMWVNFARTGNPSIDEITWDKYDSDTRKTMVLGESVRMESDINSQKRKLLEPLLYHYISGNASHVSYNVPHTYRVGAAFIVCLVICVNVIAFLVIFVIRRRVAKRKKSN